MRAYREAKGLPVIDARSGEQVGTIRRAYFDSQSRYVVGFGLDVPSGIFEPEHAPLIDTTDIATFGPDAVLLNSRIDDAGKDTTSRFGSLVELESLLNRWVLSDQGRTIGRVSGFAFDEWTYSLLNLEVGNGGVGPIGGNSRTEVITSSRVLGIGPDAIVVTEKRPVTALTA